MRQKLLVLVAFALVFGFGTTETPRAQVLYDAQTIEGNPDVPPTKRKKLLNWLLSGAYRETYAGEPAVHASAGPHGGNVRTYFNPILADDLAEGRTTFRKGAAMVKELYFGTTDTIGGYSVMIKVKKNSGDSGSGWLFYETFNLTGSGAFYGRGIGICANCHSGGTDYLLSPFRP